MHPEIYALTVDEDFQHDIRLFADPDARRGDITILHVAVPSPMSNALAELSGGRRHPISQHHAGSFLCALSLSPFT